MKTLHLLVTSLCNRNCKYCCNKQQNLPSQVTKEDIEQCDTLCITGGEPFLFSNPCSIARYFKERYYNIKKVYVYTNAYELYNWLYSTKRQDFSYLDGLSISLKDKKDLSVIGMIITVIDCFDNLSSNRINIMVDYDKAKSSINELIDIYKLQNRIEIVNREWQEHFVPADNCIFRRA